MVASSTASHTTCLTGLSPDQRAFVSLRELVSSWPTKPILVDGKTNDWNLPLRFFDSASHMVFDFMSDSTNLYLGFLTSDIPTQVKVMQAGMKITLVYKGKPKRKASVNYPLEQLAGLKNGPTNMQYDEETGMQTPDIRGMRASFALQNTAMNVEGFASRSGRISNKDASGINASIQFDSLQNMVYELCIPLKQLFGEEFKVSNPGKELSLEVFVNSFVKPQSQTAGGSPGQSMPGPGGTNPSGSMNQSGVPGGGMGSASSYTPSGFDNNPYYMKSGFKQKFGLMGR